MQMVHVAVGQVQFGVKHVVSFNSLRGYGEGACGCCVSAVFASGLYVLFMFVSSCLVKGLCWSV